MKIERGKIGSTVAARLDRLDAEKKSKDSGKKITRGTPGATLETNDIVANRSIVSNWRAGKCPDIDVLIRIADFYGTTVSYLIGETEEYQDGETDYRNLIRCFDWLDEKGFLISFDYDIADPYRERDSTFLISIRDLFVTNQAVIRQLSAYLHDKAAIENADIDPDLKKEVIDRLRKNAIKRLSQSAARPEESEDK